MLRNGDREITPEVEKKEDKRPVAMVPIFSWQTIIRIIIGLIIGAGLGLGYWILSPMLGASGGSAAATETGSTGLFGSFGMEQDVVYASKVRVQIVSPGSDYVSLNSLQQRGEYYVAKANSLPFFEFLSQELAKQKPEFSYNADEINQIITTEYDYNSELPTIKIRAVGSSEQEAVLLAELATQAFRNFLIAEESDKRQKEYQNTLEEIESVKAALYAAEQELDALTTHDIFNDPSYITLSARVEALQRELDTQAAELKILVTPGDNVQQEYEKTLQRASDVSAALIKAEQKLRDIEEQVVGSDLSSDAAYVMLNAKINALELELDRLMTGWTETSGGEVKRTVGLAEMIVNGDTGPVYENKLEKVETVSTALAEAKKEIAVLEVNSSKHLAMNLDYRLAQTEVDTLNAVLSQLHERLTLLSGEMIDGDNGSGAQEAFDRTSAALAEARKELAIMEKEMGYDRLAIDLNYRIAQEKVDNLNNRMEALIQKLSLELEERTVPSEITSYLVAGKSGPPYPVLPERPQPLNILMMGAIAGAVIAWAILNFRWIAKGMPSSSTPKSDEDEKE